MQNLLHELRKFDALRDQDEDDQKNDKLKITSTESIAPEFASNNVFELLNPKLMSCIQKSGIGKLYSHQAEAVKESLQGHDVVLESPTASGKTLSFSLPMLDILSREKNSHALMIYPMKALANDQRRQLEDFSIKKNLNIDSWLFDGDTDKEYRKIIKQHPPNILITNPDSLHLSFLGWSDQWEKFFVNLKYIVIDEIHEYRGYFGTNFALLMRRFLFMLKQKGIKPQLFLSTATCANPKEHAERLTGRKFVLVSGAKKITPKRNFLFIDPNIPDFKYYNIFSLRIAKAGLACLSKNYSTLVFCPSRKFSEDCYKTAVRCAKENGLNHEIIAPYRSGYTAEERRTIESGLRDGKYKLVFSTNALELGIDIGKLDVVILAGFPDSVLSAWQRIGRVGRNWEKEAHVIFYALNNAVDKFYAGNIDAFINKPLDEITIGMDNDEIIERHLPFLLHESKRKISENDSSVLGKRFCQLALESIKETKPIIGGKGPYYLSLNVRGNSSSMYRMFYHDKEIGNMSDAQVFKEAYIGAIYHHISNTFTVKGHGNNEIFLEKTESHLVTEPMFFTIIQRDQIYSGFRFNERISIYYGNVTIIDTFSGYKVIDKRNENIIDEKRDNKAKTSKAHAFWIKIEDEEFSEGSLKAVENMFRVGAIFIIPTDRYDTSTFCNPKEHEIYFYENYTGGIGVSEKALTAWGKVLQEGVVIAENCSCKKGCPKCIHPPRLKDAALIDKEQGLLLAKKMIDISKIKANEEFDKMSYAWKKI